ncbi:MAG TPA: GreA/GreB family elongation factor [Chthoniobacteraceae bacterium]|jgi:transcription elongation GreA/GreB family factor|nr:GreA/GreB family elongation factor [Chthoniobacteraceae bacterium]
MDAEIQKAVDSGKITSHAGHALQQLMPGSYCLHKSWGFGRVDSVNFLVSQITVDFQSKKGHTMQLQYAAESLQPIPPEHILAQKASDLAGLKARAKEDPVGVMRTILNSFGGKATQDQVSGSLMPEVFNETEWKRWWDNAKKALKKDGYFSLATKKGEPIVLREQAISRENEVLEQFSAARQLKDQLLALDAIIKNLDSFNDSAPLRPVVTATENAARKSLKLNPPVAFELLLARNEICERTKIEPSPGSMTLPQMLRDEERNLVEILPEIGAAKQKRVLAAFPEAFGEEWVQKAIRMLLRSPGRVVSEIARLLQDQERHGELKKEIDRSIRDHSLSSDVLYWLCKERNTSTFNDLISAEVFSAILTGLERDQLTAVRPGGRMHDLLLEDRELIPDLLTGAEVGVVRETLRKLLLTPVFEELNKRSLLGRIVRVYPEMQAMLEGDTGEKQEALIVSWESLERKKEECEELKTKKIPENIKEIAVARSYGDLRENFEFKAAKEMQRVLQRRLAETETALSRARGTDFSNAETSQVSIGTIVTFHNLETGAPQTYTILGAWDGQAEKGILSYQSAMSQALIAKKVGEIVDLPTEHGTEKVEIDSIEAYNNAAAAAVR